MVYHGFKVNTTKGTSVPLTAKRIMASFVTIFPRVVSGTPNQGEVRIGGNPTNAEVVALNGVQTGILTGSGMRLSPGDAGVVWPMMAVTPVDLSTIHMDVDNNGDGVQFFYGKV